MSVSSDRIEFPDPKTSETLEGVILVSGKLNTENLVKAYSLGIFPWPHEGYPLLWFCPDQRGVLDFSDLHIPKSLQKWLRKNEHQYRVTVNQNFKQVISECRRQKRKDQSGSWINLQMQKAYLELHEKGYAKSLEVWENDQLIAGIYGVQSKTYFSCESMFFKKTNTSKLAFLKLIDHLKSLGFEWMDLQMVTDVSGSFGAKYITKSEFLKRI